MFQYKKFVKQLTPAVRICVGGVLFLVGLIILVLSRKEVDMYAFYTMAAALICFSQVIVEKLARGMTDPMLYTILNLLALLIGFALTTSDEIEGMVLYAMWGGCFIAAWVANAALLRCDGAAKRAVMGFVAALLNFVLIGILFVVLVVVEAFWG